ncbi:MAG: YkvA family protein [Spirosomaceae bacterium]|jgi:uncharacterized membrane protein YkvA (DUF1232 family)|nr:YkvA family protein [Spirosomataceae bacterium]
MSTENLLTRVLKSVFFEKATGKAGRYIKNSSRLFQLLKDVLTKSKSLRGEGMDGVRDRLNLLVRMLRAYATGQYRTIPWKSLTRVAAVLLYFISPIDVLPDIIPVVGLTDDVALIMWLFSAISDDLEAFRQWDKTQNTIQIEG